MNIYCNMVKFIYIDPKINYSNIKNNDIFVNVKEFE